MQIITTQGYKKIFQKFIIKHPNLLSRYKKVLYLMGENIFHPSLRLHQLQGEHKGIYSISINISYRITLDLKIENDIVILLNIGSHDEVY